MDIKYDIKYRVGENIMVLYKSPEKFLINGMSILLKGTIEQIIIPTLDETDIRYEVSTGNLVGKIVVKQTNIVCTLNDENELENIYKTLLKNAEDAKNFHQRCIEALNEEITQISAHSKLKNIDSIKYLNKWIWN